MEKIFLRKHILCNFLLLESLTKNLVIGTSKIQDLLIEPQNERPENERDDSIDKLSDSYFAKDSIFVFNAPLIMNVKNKEMSQIESINGLMRASKNEISKLKATLCSLFRVSNFKLDSIISFKNLDYRNIYNLNLYLYISL